MVIHIVNGFGSEKTDFFTIYPQIGTISPFRFALKALETAVPGLDSGQEHGTVAGPEPECRGDQRNCAPPAPSYSLKPIPLADYGGFHARQGSLLPDRNARCQPCQSKLHAKRRQRRVDPTNTQSMATATTAR